MSGRSFPFDFLALPAKAVTVTVYFGEETLVKIRHEIAKEIFLSGCVSWGSGLPVYYMQCNLHISPQNNCLEIEHALMRALGGLCVGLILVVAIFVFFFKPIVMLLVSGIPRISAFISHKLFSVSQHIRVFMCSVCTLT